MGHAMKVCSKKGSAMELGLLFTQMVTPTLVIGLQVKDMEKANMFMQTE